MSSIVYDVKQFIDTYFGGDYVVPDKEERDGLSRLGTPYECYRHGIKVFLPISLMCDGEQINLECATISVSGSKRINTSYLSERKGSVKEIYDIDDYTFTINGVLIDHDNCWPDDQMALLQKMFETSKAVELHCALSDYFLQENKKVCIKALSVTPGEDKNVRHIPFSMTVLSDYIDGLEIV